MYIVRILQISQSHNLTQEGIDFKKSYNSYKTTEFPYIDTHMGGSSDIDDSKPVSVIKYRFEGVRVFL